MEVIAVISGKENYLRDREQEKYIAKIERMCAEPPEILQLPAEMSPEEFGAQLEFSPLFALQRVIILKDPVWLGKNYLKVKGYKNFSGILESYLKNPPEGQTIIINVSELGKGNPLVKKILAQADKVEVKSPTPTVLKKWLQKRIAEEEKVLAPAVLEQLAKSGQDMYYLDNFIRQLGVMETGDVVEMSDISPLLDIEIETNIFKLLDGLFSRQLRATWQAWYELSVTGTAEGYVLYMIIWQLELLCRVKAAREEGMSAGEIEAFTGQKAYTVKKMLRQEKNFNWPELRELQKILLNADLRLKSSSTDTKLLLESVMLRFADD